MGTAYPKSADFKGGGIWQMMLNINSAMKAVGYGLLVLFFAAGIVKTCGSFVKVKRLMASLHAFLFGTKIL